MAKNLDYNFYMRRAMQHMISEVLSEVAENGLPGEHHFYISFRTPFKGVDMPNYLRASYPSEMTIVLQEWFQDLAVVEDDRFAVTLSFHGKAENLVIPFAAITGFSDPSAHFNLRFDIQEDEASDDDDEAAIDEAVVEADTGNAEVIQLDRFRKR